VGLGLSISYGIIQKHLGHIAVADTGPEGTTFVVELPACRPGQPEAGGLEKEKKHKTSNRPNE
jgi:signal transduction histidine kinase